MIFVQKITIIVRLSFWKFYFWHENGDFYQKFRSPWRLSIRKKPEKIPMFIKICDGKEDFCNEVITNMSLQYMIHSVSCFQTFDLWIWPHFCPGFQNYPPKMKPTHVNITDNFYDTGSPKPVINREDSDLNLVWFPITYASYDVEIENFGSKWLFLGLKLRFLRNFELKRVRIFNMNSLFNYCKGHVRNKCAKAFRTSKF